MTVNRRRFLQTTAATAAAAIFSSPALAEDPISVASIHDLSGGLDIYGKPMVDALTLGIEEANAASGLLGRQIKLINYDTQSNMQLYTQFAQQAALKDKVAVVHGGITSASREVVRPVLDRFKTLYFYNTQYEGGVCDRNQFDTGVTPAQTVEKLVPYAMKKWGVPLDQIRISDDRGVAKAVATVKRNGKRIATARTGLGRVVLGTTYFVGWHVPLKDAKGRYTFCVVATDRAGNHSRTSCALLAIK